MLARYLLFVWDGMKTKRNSRAGAIIVEYALVMAIVVVQIVILLAPGENSLFFPKLRDVYSRIVIVISMPWL